MAMIKIYQSFSDWVILLCFPEIIRWKFPNIGYISWSCPFQIRKYIQVIIGIWSKCWNTHTIKDSTSRCPIFHSVDESSNNWISKLFKIIFSMLFYNNFSVWINTTLGTICCVRTNTSIAGLMAWWTHISIGIESIWTGTLMGFPILFVVSWFITNAFPMIYDSLVYCSTGSTMAGGSTVTFQTARITNFSTLIIDTVIVEPIFALTFTSSKIPMSRITFSTLVLFMTNTFGTCIMA